MQEAKTQSTSFFTAIWVVLVMLTLMMLYVDATNISGKRVMLVVLFIAMIKGQLITNYFMGLSKARLLWRGIMFFYFVIVGGLIALAYLNDNHL